MISDRRARALLFTLLTGTVPLWASQEPVENTRVRLQQEQAYRTTIEAIESDHGAYGAALPEQILGLGYSLQNQGRHLEALDLFKRGVHLARINDGLYSPQQLPLLQAQITSHIALGQYFQADERQHYMYRVQVRSMDRGELRAQALMQQAQWQYNAYNLELGNAGFARLMNMWDLYRMALTDIMDREGEQSPRLLSPLQGMLQAQYLIADYKPDEDYGEADDLGTRQKLSRFNAYRAQSYDRGSAVILAMHNIEELQEESADDKALASANALVMLGDWRLWNEERDDAYQAYREAAEELVGLEDAQLYIERLFGEPVALPNMQGVRPLPEVNEPEVGDILLEFGVTKRGRVVDLERVDENEDVNRAVANRLMRKLRKTRFRPRFEAGAPVDTEKVVRAYEIE